MEVHSLKLKYFEHLIAAENLSTSNLYGRIDSKTAQGRPRRRWSDDIKDWTKKTADECMWLAQDRCVWRELVSTTVVADLQT